jgi:MarR family transcriptional regulator, organic hydroperoxide resistance regulator
MTTSAEQTEAAERFEAAWDRFVLAVRRAQARGPQGRDDLTLAQYHLLRPIARGDNLPLSQLAEAAGVTAPTATRIIDGLERAGAVRRSRSMADRRTVFVSLTAEGRRRMRRKRDRIARRRHRLYEALDPQQREEAERVLRHLTELLGEL